MKAIILFVFFLFVLDIQLVTAQDESSRKISGMDQKYSLLWGGVETSTIAYINNDTKDSNSVNLYMAPYINYSHKSGFGARVKSYLFPAGSDPGFYLTSLSAYFAKYTGKVYPFVSYTRYIQHDNPSVYYSPIQNELYAHLRVKTKYIDPVAGIDIGFGQDEQSNNEDVSDVNAFAGVSHLFAWQGLGINKNNALGLIPAMQINAGTDRYYKFLRTTKYISQNTKASRIGYSRGSSGNGNSNQGGNSGTMETVYTVSEENSFELSNIEVNLYVMYFLGRFSIEPSGSLYFPLRGDDRTPYGYWQLNLNYWLK